MATIACIVEGHGEVEAVPLLLRRIGSALTPPVFPTILRPLRVPVARFLREGELERTVQFAGRLTGPGDGILILLDCDDACPAEQGPALLRRARAARPDRAIAVVLARREFEAWFLASALSLQGQRGLLPDLVPPADPEGVRNAKGWLTDHMERGRAYAETTDQPALTGRFDIHVARSSPSFDKCYRDVVALLATVRA